MVRAINRWRLFWVLALAISVVVALGLPGENLHSGRGLEHMILRSVRCALPLFVVAFTASSLATLWPSPYTRWLLSNRRYIGLAFAFGMAWHFSFIGYSIFLYGNQLNPRATALDLTGFVFLLSMTLTSFRFGARRLTPVNWRRLHKTGVYVIWFVATYIYLGNVRGGGDPLHYAGLSVLLAAWLLRVAAWIKEKLPRRVPPHPVLAVQRDSITTKT